MEEVFDREVQYLSKQFMKKKKGNNNKKQLRVVAKLGNIRSEMKNRVLCLYMNRMKFYYAIKTLRWYILYQSDTYDDIKKIQELEEII